MKIKIRNKRKLVVIILPMLLFTLLFYSIIKDLKFTPYRIEKEIKIQLEDE